jgi:hypothetical protein
MQIPLLRGSLVGYGPQPHHYQQGMCEQTQGHEAMPGRPGPNLILISSYLALGLGEALLDDPTAVAHPHHLWEKRCFWTIRQIIGKVALIFLGAADQQPAASASRTRPGKRKADPVVRGDRLAGIEGRGRCPMPPLANALPVAPPARGALRTGAPWSSGSSPHRPGHAAPATAGTRATVHSPNQR